MCIARVDDFTQVGYVNNASVRVLWTGPNVMYYLESDHEVIPLIGKINIKSQQKHLRCKNYNANLKQQLSTKKFDIKQTPRSLG